MQKFVAFLKKETSGQISLQVCIIGGLIIGFGALIIGNFSDSGWEQVENSVSILDEKIPFQESTQTIQ